MIDARRGEVFVPGPARASRRPSSSSRPGTVCVGDGAVRYRDVLEAAGAEVPPDDDARHLPRARFHARSRATSARPSALEPLYLRVPDAERSMRAVTRRAPRASSSATSPRSSRSSARPTRRRGRARCSRASSRSRPRSASARSTRTAALVGYLIISRYVDAWHVMNVAVAPEHRRRGIATALLERLFELTDGRRPARLHARGARLERRRDQALRAPRLPARAASAAATTPTTARTR